MLPSAVYLGERLRKLEPNRGVGVLEREAHGQESWQDAAAMNATRWQPPPWSSSEGPARQGGSAGPLWENFLSGRERLVPLWIITEPRQVKCATRHDGGISCGLTACPLHLGTAGFLRDCAPIVARFATK